MMTIKEFARLCKCNTQTLRYYDRIDLLKPVQVDPWSGYRYYTQAQAIDFVKIRNLQMADFTIAEIKALLTESDQQVLASFDQKIAEQMQKLERIKQIKQSYLTEKNNMEKVVHGMSDFLANQLTDFEVLREFGLSPADAPQVITRVKSYIEEQILRGIPKAQNATLVVNDQVIQGTENIVDAIHALDGINTSDTIFLGDENAAQDDGFSPEQYETVWECQGWNYVHEFMDAIPPMEMGKEYCFFFHLSEKKNSLSLEFPLFMLGAILLRTDSDQMVMSCCIRKSEDGQNHFALLCKK